jgi:hypothetical protein
VLLCTVLDTVTVKIQMLGCTTSYLVLVCVCITQPLFCIQILKCTGNPFVDILITFIMSILFSITQR